MVDVGGYGYYWRFLDPPPRVVIVNLEPPREVVPGIDWVVADGACLPFRDEAADVVFANSVIEHVLGAEKRHAFAREVERVVRSIGVATGLARDLLAASALLVYIPGVDALSRYTRTEDLLFRIRKNLFETLTFIARKPAS